MPTPSVLLKFAGKAVLHALDTSPGGSLVTDAAVMAEVIWLWWSQDRDAGARWAEVVALAQAPTEELRATIAGVLQDLAAGRPAETRQAVAVYLTRLIANLRRTLKLPVGAAGQAVPPTVPLQRAADLVPFLPTQSPHGGADSSFNSVTVAHQSPAASDEELPALRPPPEPGAAARITLTVTAGPHKGRTFTFVGHDTFLVGRSKRAHFQLPVMDKYFSRIHFLVEVNPPHCRLMDMGSRNGTYVNGQQVSTADLHHGDKIQAGRTILRLAVEEALPEPDGPSAPAADLPSTIMVNNQAQTQQEPARPTLPAARPPLPLSAVCQTPVEMPPAAPPRPPEPAAASRPPAAVSVTDPVLTPATLPGLPPMGTVPAPPPVPPAPGRAPTPPPQPPTTAPGSGSIRTVLPAAPAPPPVVAAVPCHVCGEPARPGATLGKAAVPVCPACLEAARTQPQPIDGFHVVRELGRGGMGVVYLAVRSKDGMLVALKTTTPAVAGNPSQVERFLREARILEQLDHPHIVAFREMGESNGQLYFAMDYVHGTDAGKLLRKSGPLAVPRAAGLVCQLLAALEYAHARKFVHRDIKPGNLLVEQSGGREAVKLADFGLARAYQASQLSGLTVMGEMGGTVAFMAPEQITHYREAKPPVDVYAAAATLYNLLTGVYIYDLKRNIQHQLLMILQEKPVPIQRRRDDLPAGLAEVVHKALAREPAERYKDARAMREALEKFAR